MFDLLKKKIKLFSEKISKAKPSESAQEELREEELEEKAEEDIEVAEKAPEVKEEIKEEAVEEEEKPAKEEIRGTVSVKPEKRVKVSALKKAKSVLTKKVKISSTELEGYLEEFELSLLEADVEQDVAEKIVEGIKDRIVGVEIDKGRVEEFVGEKVRAVLREEISVQGINFIEKAKGKKPFTVMFLGPNGAGKTTSIAKIAYLLKENGLSSVLAAADTFRAASIEQLGIHGERLGVKIISHKYGADPAAVAFDAVKSAQAKGLDVVLVDTAGRQETNVNLINELKKIVRVISPDMKLFVGEALSGHTLVSQALEYDKEIGLDGFIITKIDADVKGGTIISLISKLGKPVLFVGCGQEYLDLVEFTEDYLIKRVA